MACPGPGLIMHLQRVCYRQREHRLDAEYQLLRSLKLYLFLNIWPGLFLWAALYSLFHGTG